MQVIYKYPLEVTGSQSISMPKGAKVLCVQVQRDVPCLWAIVDLANEVNLRRFRIWGTGHPVDESDLRYIGTFQLNEGGFVGHVFEPMQE